jgi:hypothetical protein
VYRVDERDADAEVPRAACSTCERKSKRDNQFQQGFQ